MTVEPSLDEWRLAPSDLTPEPPDPAPLDLVPDRRRPDRRSPGPLAAAAVDALVRRRVAIAGVVMLVVGIVVAVAVRPDGQPSSTVPPSSATEDPTVGSRADADPAGGSPDAILSAGGQIGTAPADADADAGGDRSTAGSEAGEAVGGARTDGGPAGGPAAADGDSPGTADDAEIATPPGPAADESPGVVGPPTTATTPAQPSTATPSTATPAAAGPTSVVTTRPSPSTAPTAPSTTRPAPSTTAVPTTRPAPSTTAGSPPPAPGSGRVLWQDDFDRLDAGRWAVEHSTYGDGNNELQCYRPENVSVANGRLVLRARTETYTCPNGSTRQVTSGMVRSRGVVFAPGQALEFRVKLTPADDANQGGLWPAVWSSGWAGGGWPRGGEIDYLEVMTANDPTRSIYSIHYAKPDGSHGVTNRPVFGSTNFSDSWHTVRFEYRSGGRLVWYLDGRKVHEVDAADTVQGYPAPFDQPITEIKINLALGGRPGPLDPAAVGASGATFEVDYIRAVEL